MLVPLTNATDPYAAMMLQLIANEWRYPVSKYPRETALPKRSATAGHRGRRLALIAAALIGVAIALFVTGLI